KPLQLYIPGDVSLASFFITAVLLSENSHVTLKNMSLNPTRLIFINLLKQMGARINIVSEKLTPEPYGDVEISSSSISGGEVPPDMVGGLIDEIPCLALLGLVAEKGIRMRGAERLRNKETDRIAALCYNLKNMGAHVVEFQDGFEVYPGMKNHSTLRVKSFQDHRMVMAFSLSAFLLKQDIHIDEPEWVKISYPNFFKDMFHL
ncbi:MAG TPA: 3-phosphoshikimate 1-carboxyvinyltransferase, partial [Bdellovibrionota bacterium]|nr:3-phosphoshikimate 1-carboxyvinyltransferase [Bdellovibrionota bacterium]